MLSEVGLGFERQGPGLQRAITFLWAATQVATRVVREAFIQIYASLPDSEEGQTSIKAYCSLAGRDCVYLELLEDGYLSDALYSNPKESYLDLKVVRLMLDKVLAERFGKEKYRKLTFEVRQLVYQRNDLCHQFLLELTHEQYLSRMKQLETRLCVVINEAALIAGTTHTAGKVVQEIHTLFASLVPKNEPHAEEGTQPYHQLPTKLETATQTPSNKVRIHTSFISHLRRNEQQTDTSTQADRLPPMPEMNAHAPEDAARYNHTCLASVSHHHENLRAENGTQTDLHPPNTLEKGTQARMDSQQRNVNERMCGDASQNTNNNNNNKAAINSQYPGTVGNAGQNTEHITNVLKKSADPGTFKIFSSSRGSPGGRGRTRGLKKIFPQDGDHYQSQSYNRSPLPHTEMIHRKQGRELYSSHGTDSVTRTGPHGTQGLNLRHGDQVTIQKLAYEAVTINQVFVKVQDEDRFVLSIIVSLVLKVMLFLVMLMVSLLPLVLTLLRVMLDNVKYSWDNAGWAWNYLLDLCYGPTWKEAICVSEVVLIPRLDPVEVRDIRNVDIDFHSAGWKQARRRKGRRN